MSVQLDPITFGVQFLPESPTPAQFWNEQLRQLIVEASSGPTISSRSFALLNTGLFDLWAAVDAAAAPVYGSPEPLPIAAGDELEPALDAFAKQALSQWFPHADLPDVAPLPELLARRIVEQVASLPALEPFAELPPAERDMTRDIARWTPEHVPIDDPTAPVEQFLTPRWGQIKPFSVADAAAWRPQGPEPFLLVDEAEASFDLSSGDVVLHQPLLLPSGEQKLAGTYRVDDPSQQQWLVGEVINPAFIDQAQQVVDIQADLSDQQRLSAEFWESGGGTAFPPANWMAFAGWASQRDQLSLSEDIKLHFSVAQAVGDAGIAAWDSKWHFDYARPVRVIRDLDRLDLLEGKDLQQWMTYQAPGSHSSPPFAEYVSGHSSFSSAAAETLGTYLGRDDFDLSLSFAPGSSRFRPGEVPARTTVLTWPSFSAAALDAGMSRLYGGIHFADGNEHGLEQGRQVGRDVIAAASRYAYADLTEVLEEPFLRRNELEIKPQQRLRIDGVELPQTLNTIQLTSGDDRISIAADGVFSGRIDAGAGIDELSYADALEPVQVDLTAGRAVGLLAIAGVEKVVSGAASDLLRGSWADEWFQAAGGDDRLEGGSGFDTAIYSGVRSDYRVDGERLEDQRVVGDGSDQLHGIEWLQFADGTWPHHEVFQLPTQQLSTSSMPLLIQSGQSFDVPLSYRVSDGSTELAGLGLELRFSSDQFELLGFTPSEAVAAAGSWQLQTIEPQPNSGEPARVQLRFAAEAPDQSWPGALGGALALPLGALQFRASAEPTHRDPVSGLVLTPLDSGAGYGFVAQDPALSWVAPWSLDVDGDGEVRPLSDGLMVMKYLTGSRGHALINQTLSSEATRTTPAAVDAWISQGIEAGWLDFDGDGRTTGLGDGLMLMRSLFGMRGDALLQKALAPESPLLEGYRLDQLNGDERRLVADRVQGRIEALI